MNLQSERIADACRQLGVVRPFHRKVQSLLVALWYQGLQTICNLII
ncbi:hypothetical protein ACEWIT_003880 [Providencia rettgeri]